jgi:hypothetical protein
MAFRALGQPTGFSGKSGFISFSPSQLMSADSHEGFLSAFKIAPTVDPQVAGSHSNTEDASSKSGVRRARLGRSNDSTLLCLSEAQSRHKRAVSLNRHPHPAFPF